MTDTQNEELDPELKRKLDGIEKRLPKVDESATKQIARDTIRLAGKLPFARDDQKLDLTLAMSMLTQAAIFAQNEDTADEAKKLLALARRTAR